jgi:peptidyl-prolyl cis-trans isomerase SurA
MRNCAIMFALLLLPLGAGAGELLDQIVVTVNGNALLQSDWDGELHYELFMSGRPVSGVTALDQQSALDRIVDQELLREQMRTADFKAASREEIETQLALLKKEHEQENANQPWTVRLHEYGLTDADVRGHVELELNQLRVIDARLRPSIEVNSAEVETYYKEKVLPQTAGKPSVSMAEAEPKIREILVQQRMNQLLDSWLQSLHAQAKIQHFPPSPEGKQP